MRTVTLISVVVIVLLAGCAGMPSGDSAPADPSGGGGGGVDAGDGVDQAAPPEPQESGGGGFAGDAEAGGGQTAAADDSQVGYSVGGASDINNFRQNIEEGFLPIPSSVTTEGVYKEYYFDTGASERCEELFCPSYSQAVSEDPISAEDEQFLTVGLNSGIEQSDLQRKDLNLVVVVDVSGSMDSRFDSYHYDGDGNRVETEQRRKIDAAEGSVDVLLDQLEGSDRVGVVTFNDNARTVVPMRRVDERDMNGVRSDVQNLRADGGTNLDAAMRQAESMASQYADDAERETRVVYVTDAMPNEEGTSTEILGGQIEDHAERSIHSTFVGVGVDFNPELVDEITATRGANYYSVKSAEQFRERMSGVGFDYMVTPLVFDLSLELDAEGYEIEEVYGTPSDSARSGDIMHIETLFPSKTEGNRTKGGVVLVELEDTGPAEDIELTTSYEDAAGESHENTAQIQFSDRDAEYFENDGIRKAVVLARYAELSQNWVEYERANLAGQNPDEPEGSIEPRDGPSLGQWERQSEKLQVSPVYADRFAIFAEYYEQEMNAIGDSSMEEELDIIRTLADTEEEEVEGNGEQIDDEPRSLTTAPLDSLPVTP